MIICVSVLDVHRPHGQQHVGTFHFEIDYPADSHFDLCAIAVPPESEAQARPLIGKTLRKDRPEDWGGVEMVTVTKEELE